MTFFMSKIVWVVWAHQIVSVRNELLKNLLFFYPDMHMSKCGILKACGQEWHQTVNFGQFTSEFPQNLVQGVFLAD